MSFVNSVVMDHDSSPTIVSSMLKASQSGSGSFRLSRREALRATGGIVAALAFDTSSAIKVFSAEEFTSRRPPPSERRFHSVSVEETISRVSHDIADRELAWLFANCYPNTLDTTVFTGTVGGKPDTFVITGDINAMWLRDSSVQVWPYLELARNDTPLRSMLEGVIRRQARCILIDPYANAFNNGPTGSEWDSDLTEMKPELHERKWEIDSLCYPIRLSYGFWKATGDVSPFDDVWLTAMKSVLRTFQEQQRKTGPGPYHFQRKTAVWYDTLPMGGYGNPTRPVGLIHSGFRPSDDACIYPFLIPSNLFAVHSLKQLAEIVESTFQEKSFAGACRSLADEVAEAVQRYAVLPHGTNGEMYAYETDGFGNHLWMDDANVPSLLALPYLGICPQTDPVYLRTRKFVLGDDNPYFFRGKAGSGIGGPHVGLDMIWPISLIMQAMTTDDEAEILMCLRTLKATHAGTGFMHESFHKDDPSHFTRKWFAWANTLFGELILRLYRDHRQLLFHEL